MKELQERLLKVQNELKAPKNQYNSFGKYKYRSCEDILEAVKPLLAKHGLLITIADQVHEAGGFMYIESTVMVSYENERIASTAQAGIDPNRKGMDIAQSFGSSSSYARKYALNGMFLIDDTKDADATNTHGLGENKKAKQKLTTQIIKAMKDAVAKGNVDQVKERLEAYDYTDAQKKDILS